jgi:hypothetical protein
MNTVAMKNLDMKATCRSACIALAFSCLLLVSGQAAADLGVTDDCQEKVRELEDKIEKDRDAYTSESRLKARTELTAAKTNRLNPVKCRKNIQDARQALREGKRDKRDKD